MVWSEMEEVKNQTGAYSETHIDAQKTQIKLEH